MCIYQDFNPYPIWGRDYDMVQFSLERLLTQQANEMGFWRLGKLSPPKNQEDTSVRWVLTSQQKMVFSNDLVLLSCWFSTFFWDSFWTNLKPSYWFFWPNLYEMWFSELFCARRIPSTVFRSVTGSDAPSAQKVVAKNLRIHRVKRPFFGLKVHPHQVTCFYINHTRIFLYQKWPYKNNEFREFSLPIPKVDDVWSLHEFTKRIRNRVFIPRTVLSRHVAPCHWHRVKMLLPSKKKNRTKEMEDELTNIWQMIFGYVLGCVNQWGCCT